VQTVLAALLRIISLHMPYYQSTEA